MKKLTDQVDLEQDVETMLRFYLELAWQRKEIEGQEDELKAKIKEVLHAAGAKGGTAGQYIAKLTLSSRTTLDKSLIPSDIIRMAEKKTQYEKLTIRKIQEDPDAIQPD